MKSNIIDIARKTIPEPDWKNIKIGGPDGMTEDIIQVIIRTIKKTVLNLSAFASHLKGATIEETLRNDWTFVRNYIAYKLDPDGDQFIKSPARTFWDGFADCKGFSIFLASLLFNQGFKNFGFRFVSYSDSAIYTHVYIYVNENGRTYILDAVPGIPTFDFQKEYRFKKDIPMTQISQMTGISGMTKKVINTGNRNIDEMSEAELDLWIARDRLLTEKAIVEKIQGIGSLKAEKYQDSVDMLEDAILEVQKATVEGIGAEPGGHPYANRIDDYKLQAALRKNRGGAMYGDIEETLADIADMAVTGKYSLASKMAGIGSAAKKEKRKQAKKERKEKINKAKELRKSGKKAEAKEVRKSAKTKTGKFLAKVGRKVKAGVKAVTKVLTAPQRLLVKGIIEVSLPQAAPAFLYLFVNDKNLIAKLPPAAAAKRKKAEKTANFICNTIGMKRTHFMGICRNGIMKAYGKSPEAVIAEQMKGVAGIGAVAVAAAAFKVLTTIIKKIAELFGKKPDEEYSEDEFIPDPSSEDEISIDIADNIKSQEIDESDSDEYSPADEDNGGARKLWKSF